MAEKRLICFYTFIHVFHFSDGIGRTGTYCLLDMVLNRMAKGAKEIDIAATLEHIRDQRNGAVATKQQFQFVLQAVAEEVRAINKYIINYLLPCLTSIVSTLFYFQCVYGRHSSKYSI